MSNPLLKTQIETPVGLYRWHENWISIPANAALPVNGRTHGIAVALSGRIYIIHQANPAVLVYEVDGRLADSWGNYPGAHGLTRVVENGVEFLWLTDEFRCVVEKLTLEGQVVAQILPPAYAAREPYIPTGVAVNETRNGGNGDVYVADGYGSSCVIRYDAAGNYLATLDGTEGGGRFDCPHGIWFDPRKKPMELYIADRGNHRVQVYDEAGKYLRTFGEEIFTSPDCFAADGDRLIIPELYGRVTVLDSNDRLLCHWGENDGVHNDPQWPDGNPIAAGKFNSPHSATADDDGNIYVVEWRIGGRVLKLEKVNE